MTEAWKFTNTNGMVFQSDYRAYNATDEICDDTSNNTKFYNRGWEEEDFVTTRRMKEVVLEHPVPVAIYVNHECFHDYAGGIIMEPACNCSDPVT